MFERKRKQAHPGLFRQATNQLPSNAASFSPGCLLFNCMRSNFCSDDVGNLRSRPSGAGIWTSSKFLKHGHFRHNTFSFLLWTRGDQRHRVTRSMNCALNVGIISGQRAQYQRREAFARSWHLNNHGTSCRRSDVDSAESTVTGTSPYSPCQGQV